MVTLNRFVVMFICCAQFLSIISGGGCSSMKSSAVEAGDAPASGKREVRVASDTQRGPDASTLASAYAAPEISPEEARRIQELVDNYDVRRSTFNFFITYEERDNGKFSKAGFKKLQSSLKSKFKDAIVEETKKVDEQKKKVSKDAAKGIAMLISNQGFNTVKFERYADSGNLGQLNLGNEGNELLRRAAMLTSLKGEQTVVATFIHDPDSSDDEKSEAEKKDAQSVLTRMQSTNKVLRKPRKSSSNGWDFPASPKHAEQEQPTVALASPTDAPMSPSA